MTGRRRTRAAAIPVALLASVPIVFGIGYLATPVPEGCFEYCDVNDDGAKVLLSIGAIGWLLAVGIWRRHASAMAIAIVPFAFVAMVLTIFTVAYAWSGILWTQPVLLACLVGAILLVGGPLALLAGALLDVARADGRAAREAAIADPAGGPPPP